MFMKQTLAAFIIVSLPIAGAYQDWSPLHPVRSRWGCVAAGNQGRGPGTSGTGDPDSSASCSAFCRHHPLPPQLRTGPTNKGMSR